MAIVIEGINGMANTHNAMALGPVTISSGVSVTVSSGSRWVVL